MHSGNIANDKLQASDKFQANDIFQANDRALEGGSVLEKRAFARSFCVFDYLFDFSIVNPSRVCNVFTESACKDFSANFVLD
jgi:hypothetical protein